MLVGGRDSRIQFWKGITNGPFHQSWVLSGQMVSEENIFSNCVRTDGRPTQNDDKGSHDPLGQVS
jgi:hypothetical protein